MKTAEEFLKQNYTVTYRHLANGDGNNIKAFAIYEAMEEYANQSKWISVETEPFINQLVLVVNKTGDINIAEYVFGFYWRPNTQKSFTNITHWQPLPEKP